MARTIDVDIKHLTETLQRAAAHKGTAFVEIYQNCKIFNDGVFEYATDKSVKADNILYLEHGKPLIFGKDRNKGIRLQRLDPEVVTLGNGIEARGSAGPRRGGRGAEPGVPAEPDGLSGVSRVHRRVPLRRAADVREAGRTSRSTTWSRKGPRQAGRVVRRRGDLGCGVRCQLPGPLVARSWMTAATSRPKAGLTDN